MVSSRRKGLPRAEQVAANRRLLLDAALEVFRSVGYTAASIDAIAEAAGFTKGAVYSHFESKADLFLSLLEDRIARRRQDQDTAFTRVAGPDDVYDALRQAFAASHVDPWWHLALLEFRVVAARDPRLNERYAAAHRHTIAGIVDALTAGLAITGAEPELPVEVLARVGLAIDSGGFLEDCTEPGSFSAEAAAELFGRLAGVPAPSADHQRERSPR
jgi:AcrR family transcriptional regulator